MMSCDEVRTDLPGCMTVGGRQVDGSVYVNLVISLHIEKQTAKRCIYAIIGGGRLTKIRHETDGEMMPVLRERHVPEWTVIHPAYYVLWTDHEQHRNR